MTVFGGGDYSDEATNEVWTLSHANGKGTPVWDEAEHRIRRVSDQDGSQSGI